MPKRINIQTVGVEYDESDPDGFKAGGARLGRLLGATLTGASVYELPPGQSICPYHYEYGEEEWLIVLSGRPTLRHREGIDVLEEWETVCFDVTPISYAQMGLLPQVHRQEGDIYANIARLLAAGGRPVPPFDNVPNKYLNS